MTSSHLRSRLLLFQTLVVINIFDAVKYRLGNLNTCTTMLSLSNKSHTFKSTELNSEQLQIGEN